MLFKFFFANVSAQSFYRFNPMNRARDLYTSGPHGLQSYFITELSFPAVLWFYYCGQLGFQLNTLYKTLYLGKVDKERYSTPAFGGKLREGGIHKMDDVTNIFDLVDSIYSKLNFCE